jgi:hypothetical protein
VIWDSKFTRELELWLSGKVHFKNKVNSGMNEAFGATGMGAKVIGIQQRHEFGETRGQML